MFPMYRKNQLTKMLRELPRVGYKTELSVIELKEANDFVDLVIAEAQEQYRQSMKPRTMKLYNWEGRHILTLEPTQSGGYALETPDAQLLVECDSTPALEAHLLSTQSL